MSSIRRVSSSAKAATSGTCCSARPVTQLSDSTALPTAQIQQRAARPRTVCRRAGGSERAVGAAEKAPT
jgi:hypothetical protein